LITASRLANEVTPAIVAAFESYEERFRAVTKRARDRFETRDWKGALADGIARLDLYAEVIAELEAETRALLGPRVKDEVVWAGMKAIYSGLIRGRSDWELAETFFNSLTRRIFATQGIDPDIEYVDSDFDPLEAAGPALQLRNYPECELGALMRSILADHWFGTPYQDEARDSAQAAELLRRQLDELGIPPSEISGAELLAAPFFRRKGAYLVGRLLGPAQSPPLVLALLNGERGIVVDAVLTDVEDVSILFSFTRSHFHVDLEPANLLARYLKRLLPRKPLAELYIAIGHHKHGKTLLYRDLLHRLSETDDLFKLAPGTPGTVMLVFTLASHDVVFKVIRDHFPAIKPATPNLVRDNYRFVFRHDRAGRLVEAQEFEHLKFDLARFDPALVRDFDTYADRTVSADGDEVVVHHAYLERRVTPLDVYLAQAGEGTARAAVIDFGQAVKDLAANGIFPGELLPKNFGVTRHGRVVCYDYDELGLLTDFSFRAMPESESDEDEFGEEPWFGVGPRDVFPEEFRRFIGLQPDLLRVLDKHHSDLYEVGFWTGMQERVRRGEIIDIFPYVAARRLPAAVRPA
jgi:isocitrate dehydrogenase kinase/phosphatase